VDRWGLRVEHMTFGAASDPPIGFATRTDIGRNDAFLRLTFRPPVPGLRRLDQFTFFSHIARTDGALQDRGVGPALSLTFDSGESVTIYRLLSVTALDDSFDLADRLPIPPGRFPNSQVGMFVGTAGQRPVSLNGNTQYQQFYGGTLFLVNGGLNVAFGARGSATISRTYNRVRVPSGRLATNVSALRLGLAFTTRAAASATVQYDNLDRVLRANARLVYMYRPGSELFLVLNGEREEGIPTAYQPRAALIKLTYLARL
jgi:hypothetical protein